MQYESGPILGAGAYATVRRAKWLQTGEAVAVKETDDEVSALREIRALGLVRHRCVVRLIGVALDPPRFGVALELMDCSLRALLADRVLSDQEVLRFARQMIDGLAATHAAGIAHMDLKPENVLFSQEQGLLKLADYGMSREIGEVLGPEEEVVTLWYRAPELLLGARVVTVQMDLWSLGCVIQEVADGGTITFLGDDEAAAAQLLVIYKSHRNPKHCLADPLLRIDPKARYS